MAGAGRRVFQPAEVLTATNVQSYLMDQAVQVYAGTAARGSAIGTATTEGMVSYLADSDRVQVALGTATWQDISPGLVAVAPTSTSVTSGTATIGASGIINCTNAVDIHFDGCFSSTFDDYEIFINGVATADAAILYRMRKAGTDSTINYTRQYFVISGASYSSGRDTGNITYIGSVNTSRSTAMIRVANPYLSVYTSTQSLSGGFSSASPSTTLTQDHWNTVHAVADSYDGISLFMGTFTGTVRIFGVRK